jgi:hypothetical protein
LTLYDKLQPVEPGFLQGEWQGFSIDTGNPGVKMLAEMRWAGKDIHSMDSVDPVMVYDDHGSRVVLKDWGRARVRNHVESGPFCSPVFFLQNRYSTIDLQLTLGS